MSVVISPFEPFSRISWWRRAARAREVRFDGHEHFEKMSLRNRYLLAGANGPMMLSVPLEQGRNQRTPIAEVRICNRTAWQRQHWRSIISAYRRAPFFEHYEHELQPLFEHRFELLRDFNQQSMRWLKARLGLSFAEGFTEQYRKEYGSGFEDLRGRAAVRMPDTGPSYQQVFEDRYGFLPGCSVLDLLFAEGPMAAAYISGK